MNQVNWRNIDQPRQMELLKGVVAKDVERFKHDLELHRINARGVLDFALAAIRTLILVNGAAVIGLLTFMGNKKSDVGIEAATVADALLAFAIGVAAGVAAACVAYLSQLELTWGKAEEGELEPKKAQWLRAVGIGLGIASTVAFFIGAGLGSSALR